MLWPGTAARRASPRPAEVVAAGLPHGSLANEACAGHSSHTTCPTVEQGQAKVFRALDMHESDLKSLITNFNTTAAAFVA